MVKARIQIKGIMICKNHFSFSHIIIILSLIHPYLRVVKRRFLKNGCIFNIY